MSANPSNLDALREWLILAAAAASAMFAGLIWWLARKRLQTRFRIRPDNISKQGILRISLEIVNRGDDDITVEKLSVDRPLGIVVADSGVVATAAANSPIKSAQEARGAYVVPPDLSPKWNIDLVREGGFASCKRVSIRLHILKSFPTIRHKKKTLTAILPAHIRSAKS